MKLIKTIVTSITQSTKRIKVFRLQYGTQEFSFKPGQWIDLHAPLEGKNIGGYTIISSVHDKGFIDLAIRESSTHPVTQYMHQEVKLGDELMITEGQGKFFLTKELMTTPLIFIAGGIGITPLLSMFRSLNKKTTKIQIFYSVSYDEDILFKDELSPYTSFIVTKMGDKKRLNLELLKNNNVDFNSHFFVCGPRSMIDDITSELKNHGVPAEKIHFEKWW